MTKEGNEAFISRALAAGKEHIYRKELPHPYVSDDTLSGVPGVIGVESRVVYLKSRGDF